MSARLARRARGGLGLAWPGLAWPGLAWTGTGTGTVLICTRTVHSSLGVVAALAKPRAQEAWSAAGIAPASAQGGRLEGARCFRRPPLCAVPPRCRRSNAVATGRRAWQCRVGCGGTAHAGTRTPEGWYGRRTEGAQMRRCAPEWPTRGSPTATLAVLTVATATWAQDHRAMPPARQATSPMHERTYSAHRPRSLPRA